MGKAQSPFTGTITNSTLEFTENDGYTKVSITYVSGTVTVSGAGKVGAVSSSAISLSSSVPGVTFICENGIKDLTIAAPAGVFVVAAS